MTTAEIARAARAALRKAFPGSKKISVTSSGDTITVRWTDYGPGKEELQEALLAAGCAEVKENFRGERYLVTPGDRYGLFWIDRYNAAELRPRASTRQGPQPRRGDPDRALCLRQGDRR